MMTMMMMMMIVMMMTMKMMFSVGGQGPPCTPQGEVRVV